MIGSIFFLDSCSINNGNAKHKTINSFNYLDTYSANEIKTINGTNQWAFKNDGSFSEFHNDLSSWGGSDFIPVLGVDVNFDIHDFEYKKIRPVVIAIIDTDIDMSHKALKNRIWKNTEEIPSDKIDNDKNGYIDDINGWNFYDDNNSLNRPYQDGSFHSTYIAALLVGNDDKIKFTGMLSYIDSTVMCLKVLSGENSVGRSSDICKAIEYAEKNGANICCLALSTTTDSNEIKNSIRESNMLFIVSAGNNGINIDDSPSYFPASYNFENMITVADLRCDGLLSETSNFGKFYVDVAAPGTDILSACPNNQYIYCSGTSFAVPFVAGEAALIYSESTRILAPPEIKNIILSTTKQLDDLRGKLRIPGIIDVSRALESLN
jgi:subtilisin family serine protease